MSDELRQILARVATGEVAPDAAFEQVAALRSGPIGDWAVVDHDRAARCGVPEVVFGEGKEPGQMAAIAGEILERSPRVLLTRVNREQVAALRERFPGIEHHERARCAVIDPEPLPRLGLVALVAAGTSDLPVAEEARITLETLGNRVETFYDVGVAGLHRLLERLPRIREANVAVAVAGMEGALPSVLAGQIARPVIAVPTSVGYGASFEGIGPLLTMLASCAAGVGVVNIDNGFGAGYLAASINRQTSENHSPPE